MKNLLLLLLTIGIPFQLHADVEADLTRHDSALGDYKAAFPATPKEKLSEEDLNARRQWFVQKYPGSDVAVRVKEDWADALFDAEDWERFIPAAADLIDQNPRYGSLRAKLLYMLVRVSLNKGTPPEMNKAAFEVMLPRVRNAPAMLAMKGNDLAGLLGVPPKEQFRLALQGVETAGSPPQTREFLWRFLSAYAKEAPEAASPLIEDFLRRYPQESAVGREARELLLQLRNEDSGNGDALKKLQKETKAAQAEVARLCVRADRAADEGDFAEVGKCFDALAAQSVWAIDIPWWGKFVSSHEETLPRALVKRAIESVPPGVAGAKLNQAVVATAANYRDVEGVCLVAASLDKFAEDIQRDGWALRARLLNAAPLFTDEKLRTETYQKLADIALRLGMADVAAEYLFHEGRLLAVTDPDAAKPLLEKAVALASGSESAINAAWLLALLKGEIDVVAPLAPRNTLPGDGSEPPDVPLPKVPPPAPTVLAHDGAYTLVSQNPKDDLALWDQRFGTVSSSKERWEPKALPASVVVPLRDDATLESVRVRLTAPSKLSVTLLDAEGRLLSLAARNWPLWDPGDLQVPWPDGDQVFTFPPVAGARFVRVDLFESMTDRPALDGVEAHGTPYVAEGTMRLEPQKLPAGAGGVTVQWQSETPSHEVVYDMKSEAVIPYPIARWHRPWFRKEMRDQLGVFFRGENPRLSIIGGPGTLSWSLNGVKVGTFEQPDSVNRNEQAAEVSLGNMRGGGVRQMLRVDKDWLNGRAVTSFGKLTVDGHSQAGVRVRFGDAQSWEQWQGPFFDHPAHVKPGGPATRYQVEVVLDARAVLAGQTPVLSALSVQAEKEIAEGTTPTVKETTFLPEDLDAVVESLRNRSVAVAYSKVGTRAEYEIAKRLAERAGVPLISDDVGLNLENDYYGPILAVGTPRTNRFARQLPGLCGVWKDPDFLNNGEGVVGRVADGNGDVFDFVTGATPAAVEKAGERLLAKAPHHQTDGPPFRLLASNSLEVLYPWMPRAERPAPDSLDLRLAINDRRHLQFGVFANRTLDALNVSAGALKGPDGATLPAPDVRALGGYEWMYFFGDLRLPNFLLAKPVLPVPANLVQGFWVTVKTPENAKPGMYEGTVTVTSGTFTQSLPLRVEVLPVKLPDLPRIDTFSYAGVPWWYQPGTGAYDNALRALAMNECEKRVNTVGTRLLFDWSVAANTLPLRQAIAAPGTALEQLKWQNFTSSPKTIPAGLALFVAFRDEIDPVEIGGGFSTNGSGIKLAAVPGPQFPAQVPLVAKGWCAMRIPTPDAKARVFQLQTADGKPFEAGMIRAFPDKDSPIVTYDFSETLRDMDVFDEVYAKAGLPPPNFHLHVPNVLGPEIARNLFGVGDSHAGGGVLATEFVSQLRGQLHAKGRDKRTILKVGDEPRTLTEWAEVARPYKEGGLRVMTAHYSGRPDVKAAVGVMNPWCPNYEHDAFDPVIRARQKAGDRVWWYQCGVPPTRLTGKPADNLPIYWLTAKWNLDGVANYAALGAKESGPEGCPIPFRYDHGMAFRIHYLPDGTLLDTQRRELEADGIKDYTLIAYIHDRIVLLKSSGKEAEAKSFSDELDAVINGIVPGIRGYPTDPQAWLSARNRLYDLAVKTSQ